MKVEMIGKFYDNHSLTICNRYLALHLKDKVDLRITPLDAFNPVYRVDEEQIMTLRSLETKDRGVPADIQLRYSYPPIWLWPNSDKTKIIFVQPWEFCCVPFEWQYKFEVFADHLIVLSKWTADRFLEGGLDPTKISVVPCGYNPAIFNESGIIRSFDRQNASGNTGKYVFLFVGCVQYRKGLDILLAAWKNHTKRDMPLLLYIKDTPQIYGDSNLVPQLEQLQNQSGCAEIVCDTTIRSEQEMAQLYKSAHCIVHPYRGEGFGMPIQEAMACGCIPLVTGGGSTDDFVVDYKINSSRKYVDITKTLATKPGDAVTLMNQHHWIIEPDLADLSNKMMAIFRAENLSVNKAYLHTWSDVAEKYYQVFRSVYENPVTPLRTRSLR